MNKLIRDGKVAVLVSPDYGAGWYSWHRIEELLYDPSIVLWLEAKESDKIEHYLALKYPNEYFGGLDDLTVEWIDQGTEFRIDEYDGAETIELKANTKWLVA
jgi:hypothetical protein